MGTSGKKIRPSYITDKEGITGKKSSRFISSAHMGDNITDMLRCVAWCLNDRDGTVIKGNGTSLTDRNMGKYTSGTLWSIDWCTGSFMEIEVT
jgi:hypothetical protein